MTPAYQPLIKFLARIAVDQYLEELRQHGKLLPQEIEQQPNASACPGEVLIKPAAPDSGQCGINPNKEK
jgi:hypothetical protein